MIEAQAVRIEGKGGVETLKLGSLQVREPGPGEVRVAVAAAGLNRADILQRMGFYPAPAGVPADVPGLEFAGSVAAVGEGVADFAQGDRVMGIVGGGGMASQLVVHHRELLRVPERLTLEQAAAVPEVFLTAYDALFVQGGLGMGRTALLHAVGSGIGTAAVQLCVASGARPIGTSRTAEKLERCQDLGLKDGILVQDGAFAKQVGSLTAGRMADTVLDTIGGGYLGENIKALAGGGRLVIIGLLGGAKAELPLGLLLAKRASVVGTVLRSRSLEEKASLTQRFAAEVLPLLESGAVRPVIERVMPMDAVAEAHEQMQRNEVFGKIVLRWD